MNKKCIFATAAGFTVAIMLLLSTVSMGFINLFGKDVIYQTDIGVLINSTIQSLFGCYMNRGSFIIGTIVLVAVSAMVCIMLKYAQKEGRKSFYPIAICIAFILRMYAVLFWKSEPESDFALTYELSKLISAVSPKKWGSVLSSCDTIYTTIWSAHMPFVIYQSIPIRFFGSSTVILGVINAVWGVISCLFTAAIAKKLFSNSAGRNAMLFMAFNPVCIFFTPILTNQHPAVCLFLGGVYVICSKPFDKKWISAVLGGVLFALSQLLRPEMTVAVMAVGVYWVYDGILEHRKLKGLLCLAVMLFSFFVILASADNILRENGIVEKSIMEQNMEYKIAVGLDRETKGGWSAENEALLYDESRLKEVFDSRLKNASPLIMFEKVLYQFGTYVYPWSMKDDRPFISNVIVRRASTAMMGMIAVFACMTLIFDKKTRKKTIPIVFIMGLYMAVYSVIEVQARYNYSVIPLIIILGSNIILTKSSKKSIISEGRGE